MSCRTRVVIYLGLLILCNVVDLFPTRAFAWVATTTMTTTTTTTTRTPWTQTRFQSSTITNALKMTMSDKNIDDDNTKAKNKASAEIVDESDDYYKPQYGVSFIGGDPCGSKYNTDPHDAKVERPGMPNSMKARIQFLVDQKKKEEEEKAKKQQQQQQQETNVESKVE